MPLMIRVSFMNLIHCAQCGRDGVFILNWDDY